MKEGERRAEKQAVLSKVNSVLTASGLNDTVWSIRDCDSTLFLLMYKKMVGKLSGTVAVPRSAADHATNFDIILAAMRNEQRKQPGTTLQLDRITAEALGNGDLKALHDLAGAFSVLCNSLLQVRAEDRGAAQALPAGRPNSASPGEKKSGRPSSRGAATGDEVEVDPYDQVREQGVPQTARVPGLTHADSAWEPPALSERLSRDASIEEPEPSEARSRPQQPKASYSHGTVAGRQVHAACAAAVVDAVSRGKKKGKSSTRRPASAGAGRVNVRGKQPSACMHLHTITSSVAQRGGAPAPRPKSARGPARPRSAASAGSGAIGTLTASQSEHLEREIESLQAKLRARQPDDEAARRVTDAIEDEFGARASSMYAALVKQSLAGVRRAESLQIARGIAADRNARRDEKIRKIRAEKVASDVARSHEARMARTALKEELSYRHLYTEAVKCEKERLLLAAATAEEGRRRVVEGRRKRQAALEHFHTTQLEMLQEQLAIEAAERSFRERVQISMASKLEVEARGKQLAQLAALKEHLDHNERLEYGVPSRCDYGDPTF